MKGYKIPFLAKYQETIGAGNVITLRDFLIEVLQVGVRKSPTTATLESVNEGISNYALEQNVQLEPKLIEILSVCVFARREELRRVLTELIFQKSVDSHLVDYNYNIEVSSTSK